MKRIIPGLACVFGLLIAAKPVLAIPYRTIASTNDAVLNGVGLTDFDSIGIGNYTTLLLAGVTVTAPGNIVRIQNTYAGSYNTTGNYLDNNAGAAGIIVFAFDSPQSVFGFNYGALDDTWTLNAYDSVSNLLYSANAPANGGSNNGEFIGIYSAIGNIAYATFTDNGSGDYILLDNLRYATVSAPEPSALLLASVSGAVLLLSRRRKTGKIPGQTGI